MLIDINNYVDTLNKMYATNTTLRGNRLLYRVGDEDYNYIANEDHLQGLNCNNDTIFHALGVDPYEFCQKWYQHRPGGGIFPVPRTEINRNLIRVAYGLFEACKEFKDKPKIPTLQLTEIQSISFLKNLPLSKNEDIDFPF